MKTIGIRKDAKNITKRTKLIACKIYILCDKEKQNHKQLVDKRYKCV